MSARADNQVTRFSCSEINTASIDELHTLVSQVHPENKYESASLVSLGILLDKLKYHIGQESSTDWRNTAVFAKVGDKEYIIQAGLGTTKLDVVFDDKSKPVIRSKHDSPEQPTKQIPFVIRQGKRPTQDQPTDVEYEQIDDMTILCKAINKRVLGKAITEFCGNEGTDGDRATTSRREILQAVISHIPVQIQWIWTDAELKAYDVTGECFAIFLSGNGRHRFMANYDENNRPYVKSFGRHSQCQVM